MHHVSIDQPPPHIKKQQALFCTRTCTVNRNTIILQTPPKTKTKKKNNPKITKNPQKTKTRKTKNHQTINSSHRRPIRLSY